ncbi:MAG: biopolymer transporter ExbD [Bacteroidales bacterium]|nr:biopolymer transporter ExbD [Bacteroidales bacterium]
MARFKKKKSSGMQKINTSALPDIIFMLLFFFMVTTTMREVTLIVQVKPPEATEVQKLEKKSLVSYIYVGVPIKTQFGTESRIQLNDAFANTSNIAEFIAAEKNSRDEADRKFLTTSIKADKRTRMGVITDIKQELRKVGALKINYSSRKVAKLSY